ncbi:geranylgeranyl reductase family protein [Actinomadura pelletieri DSM 43383]|uniref:Geranylgeranyl reductase family protein n=1 Tax=Actinomadura pelletieri DSM 43383 TaxID=1120940 RepID=A0A495QAN6_9ACTN|nr:geranylgeranyl reductase family protein [Actinomadura pelletieri]RKS68733.1 geranylgeranyl reductase family protein [Actinomadura pelletieri DSM 43383]
MTSVRDVIVVGAGPAGSAVACHLARFGLDVLVLEKSSFPREKVCGDGLTPGAVQELRRLGVDVTGPGWFRTGGIRFVGGGHRLEIPWPDGHGLTRTRADLDELLARNAVAAGADLRENTKVTGPLRADGRVTGVRTAGGEHRARLVIAADGASSRLCVALGLRPRRDRPIGIAGRRYYRSPRHDDDHLEIWLDLAPAGYGWVFGMGDGTCNVGVALLRSAHPDYHGLMSRWLARLPPEWGLTDENAVGPVRGAALPMGFSRAPHHLPGLLLVGDSGGMVNPFSGEGIAYALEAGRIAADVIMTAFSAEAPERVLRTYPAALKRANGGPFTLGRAVTRALDDPRVMRLATRHGLSHPSLMRFALTMVGGLPAPAVPGAADRIAAALTRITPAS